MEPTNLIVEQLKKIREELVGLRGDVRANGERIDRNAVAIERNTSAVASLADRTFALEEAVVGNTAQVTMLAAKTKPKITPAPIN